MSRYKIIPAKSWSGAFFVNGDEAHVMRVAGEARDAVGMSMVVVHHPPGGLIKHVGTVEYVDDKPAKKVKRGA